MDLHNYNPFKKTAIKRRGLSNPTKYLQDNNKLEGAILNFGCGHNEDGIILSQMGYDITSYDKFNPVYSDENLLLKKYDTIICNYVFNVIPSLAEHEEVLKRLKTIGENVYIAVRTDFKAVKPSWKWVAEYQGWITPKGSFQRMYSNSMADILFGDVEVLVNNSSFLLIKIGGSSWHKEEK